MESSYLLSLYERSVGKLINFERLGSCSKKNESSVVRDDMEMQERVGLETKGDGG